MLFSQCLFSFLTQVAYFYEWCMEIITLQIQIAANEWATCPLVTASWCCMCNLKILDDLQVLEELLPKGMIIPSAYETVGHIAHLNLRDEHLQYKHLIAKVFSLSV